MVTKKIKVLTSAVILISWLSSLNVLAFSKPCYQVEISELSDVGFFETKRISVYSTSLCTKGKLTVKSVDNSNSAFDSSSTIYIYDEGNMKARVQADFDPKVTIKYTHSIDP